MGVEILPIILKRLGYETIAVVSNYLLRRRSGWAQGKTKKGQKISVEAFIFSIIGICPYG
jgi:hypothetical protein